MIRNYFESGYESIFVFMALSPDCILRFPFRAQRPVCVGRYYLQRLSPLPGLGAMNSGQVSERRHLFPLPPVLTDRLNVPNPCVTLVPLTNSLRYPLRCHQHGFCDLRFMHSTLFTLFTITYKGNRPYRGWEQ